MGTNSDEQSVQCGCEIKRGVTLLNILPSNLVRCAGPGHYPADLNYTFYKKILVVVSQTLSSGRSPQILYITKSINTIIIV